MVIASIDLMMQDGRVPPIFTLKKRKKVLVKDRATCPLGCGFSVVFELVEGVADLLFQLLMFVLGAISGVHTGRIRSGRVVEGCVGQIEQPSLFVGSDCGNWLGNSPLVANQP